MVINDHFGYRLVDSFGGGYRLVGGLGDKGLVL